MKRIRDDNSLESFSLPDPVMSHAEASATVDQAINKWQAPTLGQAQEIFNLLACEFPDQAPPDDFWNSASSLAFRDFFVWGHDHNFGHGVVRRGAMMNRHLEIATEAIEYGLMPVSLAGRNVLDVGCWTGGDLLVLAGLGATLVAIEEHSVAARAARRLFQLSGVSAEVIENSVYMDRKEWAGFFDYIYCSGVIYHVTDPLLFTRILFSYLKPGGEIIMESKSTAGEGSLCTYSGTMEKGWNWYAPNEMAFGRWLVDAGFDDSSIRILRRKNGRLIAGARKINCCSMRETAGFSRPGSWLEGVV